MSAFLEIDLLGDLTKGVYLSEAGVVKQFCGFGIWSNT